jgi:tetratricopeptide (TPR) repeat protein
MNLKLLKQVGIFFITIMAYGSQLTYADGQTQIPIVSKQPLISFSTNQFVSKQHEQIYKFLVAEIAGFRGNQKLAAIYFLDLATEMQNSYLAERATRAALYAQNYSIAQKAASLWINITPKNPQAHQVLGSMLLLQKNPDEAMKHFEVMVENIKDHPKLLSSAITAIIEQQQDRAHALKMLANMLTKMPKNPVILLSYSRLLLQDKQFDPALKVLRTLLTVVPDHGEAVPLYAYVLEKQGKKKIALYWMKQALQSYPKKKEWRLMYARMLADAEQFEDSIEQFKQLLPENNDKEDILYALGILSVQINQLSSAKEYFLQLIKIEKRVNTSRYYLGQIAQEEKKLKKAIYWYKQIDRGQNYLNAQARIALILAKQGKLDEAIKHLQAARLNHQDDAINLMILEADLLDENKRYNEAMAVYSAALKLEPKNTELLYMRAMTAEKLGDIALLEQDLRRIFELEPKNADSLNALGYSLLEHTNRYQEAYELIKKAFALEPSSYYILDSMGWVLHKLGENVQAISYLRKALTQQNDPEIAAHLGEVLWTNGDQIAAKKIWKQAVESFPNDEKLLDTIGRFLPKPSKKIKESK